jgi:hypothetical protein
MPAFRRRRRAAVGLLASVASMLVLLPASPARAVTYDNACVNSVIVSQASLIPVTLTATASPDPVAPGGTVTLSGINEQLAIPPQVFLTGYNLGLLTAGENKIPITGMTTQIAATNTVEGVQTTNSVESTATTTISDPDGEKGTGDETATPGTVNVTYSDQTWTAGGSGPIEFRQNTVTPLSIENSSIDINVLIAGKIKARFGCDPGSVPEGADPSGISLVDPAPTFAKVRVEAPNKAPNTKLKSMKIKKRKVTFKFSSDEKGSTFLCKLDKKKFAKCKSPKTYKNLKPGKHKFQVKARDSEGKLDPSPVVRKFRIKK